MSEKAIDWMDDEGFVHASPEPGLGYDINREKPSQSHLALAHARSSRIA